VRGAEVPRTVLMLDAVFAIWLTLLARTSFASLERFRRRLRATSDAGVIIVCGSGAEADLMLALLAANEGQAVRPVGFVDDHAARGTILSGVPVLGRPAELPTLLPVTGARAVIMSARMQAAAGQVQDACSSAGVPLLTVDFSLPPIAPQVASEASVSIVRAQERVPAPAIASPGMRRAAQQDHPAGPVAWP
jgi:FlaA1/EpsC-like NDP-sugar epimerase